MRTNTQPKSHGFIGYLILLLGFVSMGVFLLTLAGQFGGSAWPSGIAMVVLFVLAVAAFRLQLAQAAESQLGGDIRVYSDPMTPPLYRAQVEQYERTYRRKGHAVTPQPTEGTRLYKAA